MKKQSLQEIIESYHKFHDSFPIQGENGSTEFYSSIDLEEKDRERRNVIDSKQMLKDESIILGGM